MVRLLRLSIVKTLKLLLLCASLGMGIAGIAACVSDGPLDEIPNGGEGGLENEGGGSQRDGSTTTDGSSASMDAYVAPSGPLLGIFAPIATGSQNVLVAPMPNGGAVVLAQFTAPFTINGVTEAPSPSDPTAFLMSIDSSRRPLWAKRILGATALDSLATDAAGDIYLSIRSESGMFGHEDAPLTSDVSGTFGSNVQDGAVVKVSPLGAHVWDFHPGAASFAKMLVAPSPDGNRVSIALSFTGTLTFPAAVYDGGMGNLKAGGENWVVVLEYDAKENYHWARSISYAQSSTSPLFPTAITMSNTYDPYVAISAVGAVADGQDGMQFTTPNGTTNTTVFVAGLTDVTAGTVKNMVPLSINSTNGRALSLAQDSQGRVGVCGYFQGQITMAQPTGAHGGTNDTDGFLALIDQSVTHVINGFSLGGAKADACSGLSFVTGDEAILVGAYASPDFTQNGTSLPAPAQATAAFLLRLDAKQSALFGRTLDDNYSTPMIPPSLAVTTGTVSVLGASFDGTNLHFVDGGVTSGDSGASPSSYVAEFGN